MRINKTNIVLLFFLLSNHLFSQTPYLLADACPGITGSNAFGITYEFNDKIFYYANDSVHGTELWITDATPAGTYLLKDINPGIHTSFIRFIGVVNNKLIFTAQTDSLGQELWTSDGTTAGTMAIKDIFPGTQSGVTSIDFKIFNDVLYFFGIDSMGPNLWRTDGTFSGTQIIRDEFPGTTSGSVVEIVLVNGRITYLASSSSVKKIISVEPLGGGIYNVLDISSPDIYSFDGGFYSAGITVNNVHYFRAMYSHPLNTELFRTDGITTKLVKDIDPGIFASSNPFIHTNAVVELNGFIYFSARTDTAGDEIFSLDLSNDSITLLKDAYAGMGGTPFSSGMLFNQIQINNKFLYVINDSIHGYEMWASDGTTAGTNLLYDINPGTASTLIGFRYQLGNTLLFAAYDAIHGTELWRTDGTQAGTFMLPECNLNGDGCDYLDDMFERNGRLFFVAKEASNEFELFSTDGTIAGTNKIDLLPGTDGSAPYFINYGGSYYYFWDYDPIIGTELWRTDGNDTTVSNFYFYNELRSGSVGSFTDDHFTFSYNNDVYFIADSVGGDAQIYKTDHITNGVTRVSSFVNQGRFLSDPYIFKNRYVIFRVTTDNYGDEVWAMDCPGIINSIDAEVKKEILVFPNPASNEITINLSWNLQSQLSIYTISGNMIKNISATGSSYHLDTSDLKNGVYVLRISTNENVHTKRFIVSR